MKTSVFLSLFLCLGFNLFSQSDFISAQPDNAITWPTDKVDDLPALRTLFIGKANDIIECDIDQKELFHFAETCGYNHFILYGIKNYLKNLPAEHVAALGYFISMAHQNDITISINVSSFDKSLDIMEYWDLQSDSNKRYDALHFEKEYWNGTGSKCNNQAGPFAEYMDNLVQFYDFCHGTGSDGNNRDILCETYIGNPCHQNFKPVEDGQEQVNQIVQFTDRVYLAYYRKDPMTPSKGIFHHKLYRLDYFANAKDAGGQSINSDIAILFNAHQDNPAEKDDMFNWLNDNVNSATNFEELFNRPFYVWYLGENGFLANRDENKNKLKFPTDESLNNLNVLGFGWYKYQDLQQVTGVPLDVCSDQLSFSDEKGFNQLFQPNPASQAITINLPGDNDSGRYMIYDFNGKLTLSGELWSKINSVDIAQLMDGMYILKIVGALPDEHLVEKLMIQH